MNSLLKMQRNLKGFWSGMDLICVINDLGGLLSEVHEFCGNEKDLVKEQKIFVFLA